MNSEQNARSANSRPPLRGLAGWLLARLRVTRQAPPKLAVLERIALAPRQSLALIEADGRRFLIATSPEGTPAFYPLELSARNAGSRHGSEARLRPSPRSQQRSARVSW